MKRKGKNISLYLKAQKYEFYTSSMLKTEVFDMDKKKKPKRGFALRPSIRTYRVHTSHQELKFLAES